MAVVASEDSLPPKIFSVSLEISLAIFLVVLAVVVVAAVLLEALGLAEEKIFNIVWISTF
jgi:hypothetical protein